MVEQRIIGAEASKSHEARLASGFVQTYLSGAHILDIGYKGYQENVLPVVPHAIGVELDYPGYDGRTLPFDDNSQDTVFSSHCLEHIDDFADVLRDWFRVIRIGGFIVIMVPHQFLYEKRVTLPSRFNADHKRFYTPATLMSDIEAVLPPNAYRLRHLADNDRGFDYTIPPAQHSGGCYEIELVIEKIAAPPWALELPPAAKLPALKPRADNAAGLANARQNRVVQAMRVLPGEPCDVALYDLSPPPPGKRRILAMQLGHLGDFIIGLPALRQLRQAFPDAFIRLVVGAWNKAVAEQSGIVDDIVTYGFFPEVSRDWRGEPAQALDAFVAATKGQYDIAIDLRVDEDTRYLLRHVDATTRCGIGEPDRLPYLQIVLPYDSRMRYNKPPDDTKTLLFSPNEFHSRMPMRTPFRHRTNFSVSNQHLIYGPYISLPAGRFRATFGLQVSGLRLALRRVRLKLDVCFGQNTVALRELTAEQLRATSGDAITLEFTNPEEQQNCEFRVLAYGRPLFATLSFFGVQLERLEAAKFNRLKPAMLHNGEHLSLLVRLVADRTTSTYAAPLVPPDPLPETVRHVPFGRHRVVVAPLSNSHLRDWPLEHYVTLTKSLVERLDCTVLLIGSRPQQSALAHIVQASGASPRVVNLAGKTGWNDVPGILRSADLVICNNSGVAHLAASLGIRTLAIYSASHQPQEWGPRGAQARALMAVVPCSPCGFDRLEECENNHACMRGLLPEMVLAQAASWLDEN